ncbi:TLDc domain-containing [Brachionus plicatilis]|uniref:TLDc domain-containing n=1 Tax=Brachionus plicatilis TaxID=10195 RepID=A0A3M7T0V6_BRAPC|nr:TLDc domain-containing [Brachionus plicatilis]
MNKLFALTYKTLTCYHQVENITKSNGFEQLQIVVNSLYNIRKDTVKNKVELADRLDAKKVYSVLKYLIGSFVNVLLDENGELFSPNLSEEASASVVCVKKIQHLLESESTGRPIIIVSKINKSIIILAILTSHFQAIDSSKIYPILYSIEPATGKRDLLGSTKHKLFETYLTKGSKDNGIGQVFEPNVQISVNTGSVNICKNAKENDAWLCIYYSLLLVHEGSDAFLSDSLTWLDVDVDAIKTILAAYVPSLLVAQGQEKKIRKKNNSLNKLSNVEQDLTELFHERKRHLETTLNSIKDSCIDQQINRLENDEVRLKSASQKLIDEIAKIEEIIKQGESLLLSNKKDATTEQRFQSFITGQEKHSLEIKIRKKIEKSKQDILMYNETERNKIFDQQIKKLEQDLQLVRNNIQNLNSSIDELNKKLANHAKSIKEENNNLKSLALQLDQFDGNFKSKELEETQIKNIQSEINQINVDYHYKNLIDRLLKDDITCDKNQVNSLNRSLIQNGSKIQQLELNLTTLKDGIENNNTRVSQLRVLIDSENSSISSSRSKVGDVKSTISQLKDEFDSHNRWYSSWLYGSERDKIKNKIRQKEDDVEKLNNQISHCEKNIQNYRNEMNLLEAKNEVSRNDQISKQTDLNRTEDCRKQTIQSLKSIKDQIVANYMEVIQEIAKQKMEISKAIGINHSNQNEANESIKRNNIEIKRLNEEVERQTLSLQIAQCSKNDIVHKITQTKDKLKNTQAIQNVLEPVKIPNKKQAFKNSLIESEIISDEQFKKLMKSQLVSMQLNGNFQTWKLLYRASRDGFDACSFHQKCDLHSNTLTIICTDTLRIFGGFTGSTWSSDANQFKSDPYAFLFGLNNDSNNNKIIKCSDEKNAIYYYKPLKQNELENYTSMTNKSKKTILQAYEIFNE